MCRSLHDEALSFAVVKLSQYHFISNTNSVHKRHINKKVMDIDTVAVRRNWKRVMHYNGRLSRGHGPFMPTIVLLPCSVHIGLFSPYRCQDRLTVLAPLRRLTSRSLAYTCSITFEGGMQMPDQAWSRTRYHLALQTRSSLSYCYRAELAGRHYIKAKQWQEFRIYSVKK